MCYKCKFFKTKIGGKFCFVNLSTLRSIRGFYGNRNLILRLHCDDSQRLQDDMTNFKNICFAYDMKLFIFFLSLSTRRHNNFVAWSESLGLTLNINKCKYMTFIRRRTPTSFPYTINGTDLCPIVNSVCDLGFTFTPFLCPRAHIDNITCKELKVLGFIKRIASEFKLSNSLRAICCAFVRPIIGYC